MSEQAQPGSAQVPATRGLFVRQSSGLIREFRPSDVFIFNTLGYALGLVLAVVPTFVAGLWPEQNVLVDRHDRDAPDVVQRADVRLPRRHPPALGRRLRLPVPRRPPGPRLHRQLGLHLVAVPRARRSTPRSRSTSASRSPSPRWERDRERPLVRWSESVSKDWPTFLIGLGLLAVTLGRPLALDPDSSLDLPDRHHPGAARHVRHARRPLHDVEGGVHPQLQLLHGRASGRADVPGDHQRGARSGLLGR